ncbi:enoyl-CoA hydratase/isomerase family protein [Pollutimonas sp. M17]|uniref:enoyl-CoA hydratase/isomerase family protein n=1 Tax=Pollutimonas sp. M17 TaxID=2962065 RepID=UPI0021F444E1|nr:enoyl-CoA hydratase/isomerase family protein [Pollutimonas sp. M17]UYO93904.1 enoyl-CoA hydratase/isomerase family protein [Pollutimonas sp. M17]HWK69411.1 enoyl-CoA hydratase/isomerase family protein [Burkholderiaceae bacterium]
MNETVLTQSQDGVATVTLNRPHAMNAVNSELRQAFIQTLNRLNGDPTVRAVVITGSGDRAFCAGQDLEEASRATWQDLVPWLQAQRDMYQAVRNLDKPCIAALNGVAAGAGFQIALCADIRVAHPESRLGQPEVKAGLASIVGSYLMTLHIGMGHNAQLSLQGDLIENRRAYEIGLVNQLADDALAVALATARRLALLPSTAVRLSKQRLRDMTQAGFDEACTAGIRAQLECYANGDPQSAMNAFLQARQKKGTTT